MDDKIHEDYLGKISAMLPGGAFDFYKRKRTLINYVFSGGTGAFVNLFTLFVLTHVFRIWYLLSSIVAFLTAFGFSFYLQKHWTFRDHSNDGIQKQMSVYMLVSLINLVVNTALMYLFVDVIGKMLVPNFYNNTLWYLLSQFVSAGLIAIESFFVYRSFVFRRS
ncbi:MAG: hypothetical protein A3H57_00030 [Candidatus Taylorbacteria bacterium RIFCSPLOWO2_02_FULL_43_11]|uniref:GtrA/DPMS transmembrane domain-containing protein n=1 Tax=Candidatus Taylorbacteria bacterium RIFCSPHIGHO2_02_FULL_43_32b TaxID=1802306 RepID=A0A1G2MKC4_9BACT|nr:MAG: hypothetical protein A2743_02290 [Candidatus Taylorbacteria bacterium RIFCSPHIGHO2_01_FULL_43_47]OHA24184.1 MAG: hypothetical protein A3C72_03555 [Candidatus Taylorbacteria bacterium RIFCSPHIGHO2_02_FULL_43_32b]OHA31232.1 MAG: hypothetical protein A3B08_00660 [Candidatus Taylorbacteria bacterium RIFCSPLOWO2_01_FULL_43_44]OHA37639.1 MAG: hypothetical protein A3H57_00030 [Candidatus Taylorbacteria bacterium RIFCSPLOWO2_02_FULL_43_11]